MENTKKFSNKDYEFVLFYMEESNREMRHTEQLRERFTGMILTISMAITGFVVQQQFKSDTFILAIIVILLGVFGMIATRKLYQLHQWDQHRLDEWYDYLKANGIDEEIFVARGRADKKNKEKFGMITQIKHNWLWQTLNLLISIIGIILLLFIK